jgi:hypothetical protein
MAKQCIYQRHGTFNQTPVMIVINLVLDSTAPDGPFCEPRANYLQLAHEFRLC